MDPIEPLNPVAIAVAPNGGRRTKSDHPALPMTVVELAATASGCAEAGASMIHLHVRDKEGRHLLDADAYRQALASVRTAVGDRMVIQITSEALGIYEPEEQMRVVRDVRPEAVSLALRELAPDEAHEPSFGTFLDWLRKEGVTPQIILYSPEEVLRLAALQKRGLIPFENLPVLYVLGRYTATQTSRPDDLLPFLGANMPVFGHWMTCAFGRHETACVAAGALLGGHARVGFENNLFLPNGEQASANEDLVAAARQAISACGMAIADADALRASWNR
ncbi:3-keto-5-aminohexanoate cleavage protein [Mesorhizobium sp. ZC-5]|uniref:3-keto-5-aminohexanoate cleavage protein n=1 Tax=Mesorhizobium sp. ZC-5 TaxID=2986066 RepID=UPI0021E96899|nr:3-keto-5-aminohexanoate cleavage protein [Mesorhizobium sp. ZC-5]MCV3242447.1 3-keto-5-aminohexanoate cleavage protein [Mesorhizobium sp. ZC-5]